MKDKIKKWSKNMFTIFSAWLLLIAVFIRFFMGADPRKIPDDDE